MLHLGGLLLFMSFNITLVSPSTAVVPPPLGSLDVSSSSPSPTGLAQVSSPAMIFLLVLVGLTILGLTFAVLYRHRVLPLSKKGGGSEPPSSVV